MSTITKRAIKISLENMLLKKSLDKVTINDITSDCGINRMTFYYHFKDIYDLIEWSLIEEFHKVLEDNKTYDTWQEGFLQIFNDAYKNKTVVLNLYRSARREQLETYLLNMTYKLLFDVVCEKSSAIDIDEDNKKFIADFYKYAFVGLVLEWIKYDMKDSPKDIIDKLSVLMEGNLLNSIKSFEK